MDIEPPPAFKHVCGRFYPDIGIDYETFDEMAEFAVQSLRPDWLGSLDEFLGRVLSAELPDTELNDLWNRSPADVLIRDGESLKAILAAMQRQAQRRLAEQAQSPP